MNISKDDTIRSTQFIIVAIVMAGMVVPVLAGSLAAPCVQPAAPVLASPEAVQTYRDLIIADYDVYFTAASAYITCLDAERASVLAAMAEAVEEYAALLANSAPGTSP